MKQVLQNLKTGITEVTDARCPRAGCGQLLISTSYTLVLAGTERMLVDFGKAGLIDKGRQQPDKVRMVLDKIRTDGLMPTLHAVRNKLAQPLPMGYCNVGVVAEVGAGSPASRGLGWSAAGVRAVEAGSVHPKPSTTALASRLRRVHRPGLTRPAAQLAIGTSSGSLCNSDRLAPRCANLRHPLFGAQHASDQGRHVQVCIQLGPMQAETCGRDFDVPQAGCAGLEERQQTGALLSAGLIQL